MFEIDKKKFGSYIAGLRKGKGYTQNELAEKLFISNKAVSKWETGVSIPDASLWIPLAEILGVTVTELLMCESMDQTAQMDSTKVETLVKSAISFSDDNPERRRQQKKHRIAALLTCIAISGIENYIIYKEGFMTETTALFSIIGLIFGTFFSFTKTVLPSYYDENKISSYSNGFFRMNIPGVSFNNSNWPHIMNAGRIWSLSALTVFPALFCFISNLIPGSELYTVLILVFAGLFVPICIVGKKYE